MMICKGCVVPYMTMNKAKKPNKLSKLYEIAQKQSWAYVICFREKDGTTRAYLTMSLIDSKEPH